MLSECYEFFIRMGAFGFREGKARASAIRMLFSIFLFFYFSIYFWAAFRKPPGAEFPRDFFQKEILIFLLSSGRYTPCGGDKFFEKIFSR